MIKYNCPECGALLQSPSSIAGEPDRCPVCAHVCTVPMSWYHSIKLWHKGVAGGVLAALLVGLSIYAFSGGENAQGPQNRAIALPVYEVLNDKVYDAPIKTQVSLVLLVSGTVTETSLRNLMKKLYVEVRQRHGFKYSRSGPTHVFIHAYPDKERAQSGSGGWVAMLSRLRGEQPQVTINRKLIEVIKQKPVVRFGLTQAERKEIYKELVWADDRSMAEAAKRFPLEPAKWLKPGQDFELTERTALMPELDPQDPIAALAKVRPLRPGTTIHILEVGERVGTRWYRVRASSSTGRSLGSGWVNSVGLYGQARIDGQEQLKKQAGVMQTLRKRYDADIAKRHGLSKEELREISIEGGWKYWPHPPVQKE